MSDEAIEHAAKVRQSKDGRVVVRRLNKAEYQNTRSESVV